LEHRSTSFKQNGYTQVTNEALIKHEINRYHFCTLVIKDHLMMKRFFLIVISFFCVIGINAQASSKRLDTVNIMSIPTVVHIIHQGGIENITKEQVYSALQVLNEDFSNTNPNLSNTSSQFKERTANMGLKFLLATLDPFGNKTSGINRYYDKEHLVGNDPEMKLDYGWPQDRYLNIYVVQKEQDNMNAGFSFYPSQVRDVKHLDGVVIAHWAFGRIGTARWTHYHALTHEVGHWINLKDTWGDAPRGSEEACDTDDGVADTPNCKGFWGGDHDGIGNNGCFKTRKSCGTTDMVQNHMDNSYCPTGFTKGQKARAKAAMYSDVAGRNNLWQEENLKKTGCIIGKRKPIALFSFDKVSCKGNEVRFQDLSLNSPTSWEWTFPGGKPETSTDTNPLVNYKKPGKYDVTLLIENSAGKSKKSIHQQIIITDPKSLTPPWEETFEGELPPFDWQIHSHDSTATWTHSPGIGGHGKSGNSISIDNSKHQLRGYKNGLWTPSFDFDDEKTAILTFDVAYAQYPSNYYVSLTVSYSTDCGKTFHLLYNKGGDSLATTRNNASGTWAPGAKSWRKEAIDLVKLKGKENVIFRFENLSGVGNKIYLDNVKIDDAPPPYPIIGEYTKRICAGASIKFSADAVGDVNRWNWSFPGGDPETSTRKRPTVIYSSPGVYDVTLSAKNPNGEYSVINFDGVTVLEPQKIPKTENFDNDFPPKGWKINNPDRRNTWQQSNNNNQSYSCLVIDNTNNNKGEKDEIITGLYDLSMVNTAQFSIDIACVTNSGSTDQLKIYSSIDCGLTWQEFYSKSSDELVTSTSNNPRSWKPTTKDWRTDTTTIPHLSSHKNVMFKLENTSGSGGKIWVDNLKVLIH